MLESRLFAGHRQPGIGFGACGEERPGFPCAAVGRGSLKEDDTALLCSAPWGPAAQGEGRACSQACGTAEQSQAGGAGLFHAASHTGQLYFYHGHTYYFF